MISVQARSTSLISARSVALHKSPFRPRAHALAFRDDGLSAGTVSADDVNAQIGAVAGEGSGKDPDNVRTDARSSTREGSDQRRALWELSYSRADDAEFRNCSYGMGDNPG